jgi:hypothetical protein
MNDMGVDLRALVETVLIFESPSTSCCCQLEGLNSMGLSIKLHSITYMLSRQQLDIISDRSCVVLHTNRRIKHTTKSINICYSLANMTKGKVLALFDVDGTLTDPRKVRIPPLCHLQRQQPPMYCLSLPSALSRASKPPSCSNSPPPYHPLTHPSFSYI